jgi:hypothetical protein
MEWGGIKNGALLKLIEGESFHVFLTGDKKRQRRASRFAFLCGTIERPAAKIDAAPGIP